MCLYIITFDGLSLTRPLTVFSSLQQMTERIDQTGRKLRVINYPRINKLLEAETGAVNWVSPKVPLLFSSLPHCQLPKYLDSSQ